MPVRCPAPLRPGDLVGVTAPSSGVPAELRRRLDFCVEDLRRRGYEVLVAVRSALGDLGLPVVLDVDCGHVPPHLALVNGALATLEVDGATQRLTQTLV